MLICKVRKKSTETQYCDDSEAVSENDMGTDATTTVRLFYVGEVRWREAIWKATGWA